MAEGLLPSKRSIKRGTKVKTGCATCRIRKVKCDEGKPFCKRCIDSGRACDGYESPFRHVTGQPINNACTRDIKSTAGLQAMRPIVPEISSQDVNLLNRYFSTKTIFDVTLSCEEEAKQVLQASLKHPPIKHAVSSLKALRGDLETSGDFPESVAQPSPNYEYGIQQYCMALGGVASGLSFPSSTRLKAALLCCQIFISIEQVRENYAAMAQHIIQGLRIMHEHRARPSFVVPNNIVPANRDQLPFLDVFVIKLFAAPCRFADRSPTTSTSWTAESPCLTSQNQQPHVSCDSRTLAPDMRTELTKMSSLTLNFLDRVSRTESAEEALQLLTEKDILLNSLESWLVALEIVKSQTGTPASEYLSVSFLRYFHQILKVIIMGTLSSSRDVGAGLQTEHSRLYILASDIGKRVKAYRACSGKQCIERAATSASFW